MYIFLYPNNGLLDIKQAQMVALEPGFSIDDVKKRAAETFGADTPDGIRLFNEQGEDMESIDQLNVANVVTVSLDGANMNELAAPGQVSPGGTHVPNPDIDYGQYSALVKNSLQVRRDFQNSGLANFDSIFELTGGRAQQQGGAPGEGGAPGGGGLAAAFAAAASGANGAGPGQGGADQNKAKFGGLGQGNSNMQLEEEKVDNFFYRMNLPVMSYEGPELGGMSTSAGNDMNDMNGDDEDFDGASPRSVGAMETDRSHSSKESRSQVEGLSQQSTASGSKGRHAMKPNQRAAVGGRVGENRQVIEARSRQKLNDALKELKHMIPTIKKNNTITKAQIVQKATEYMGQLQSEVQEMPGLRRENVALKREIAQLKAQFDDQRTVGPQGPSTMVRRRSRDMNIELPGTALGSSILTSNEGPRAMPLSSIMTVEIYRTDHYCIFVDPMWEIVTGWPRQAAVGKNAVDYVTDTHGMPTEFVDHRILIASYNIYTSGSWQAIAFMKRRDGTGMLMEGRTSTMVAPGRIKSIDEMDDMTFVLLRWGFTICTGQERIAFQQRAWEKVRNEFVSLIKEGKLNDDVMNLMTIKSKDGFRERAFGYYDDAKALIAAGGVE
eukprot:Clim_evm2s45 gene=Clim_evmTU2s45